MKPTALTETVFPSDYTSLIMPAAGLQL